MFIVVNTWKINGSSISRDAFLANAIKFSINPLKIGDSIIYFLLMDLA